MKGIISWQIQVYQIVHHHNKVPLSSLAEYLVPMIFIPFTTLFSFIPKSTPFPLEQTERERDCPLKHTTVTVSLRWLERVFQGQYLPSLSNYVAN